MTKIKIFVSSYHEEAQAIIQKFFDSVPGIQVDAVAQSADTDGWLTITIIYKTARPQQPEGGDTQTTGDEQ